MCNSTIGMLSIVKASLIATDVWVYPAALIINAGGYTHTSVAIHDALKILEIPIIELHITNIYNREEFRHKSLISKLASGILCGFGVEGYIMAIQAMSKIIKK